MPGLLDPTDETDTATVDPATADPATLDPTQGPFLGATEAQPVAAPDTTATAPVAPAASDGDGADWLTRIGRAVGGGPAGIAELTPEQAKDTARRNLLNFGIAVMQAAGPSYVKRGVGQILASGLSAAEQTETGAEQTTAVQRQAAAELALQQQDRAIKLAQYRYQMQILQRQAAVSESVMRGLTGQPATPGGAAPSGRGGGDAGLPAPDAGGSIADWKDPGAAALVIAEANNQGLDPNLALAVAHQESRGDPNAPATDGGQHRGMFQIGAEEAKSAGVDPADRDTLVGNVRAGVGRLKKLVGDYGDVNLALVGYNAGTGVADKVKAGGAVPASTQQYLANVNHIVAANPAGVASPGAPGAATAAAAPSGGTDAAGAGGGAMPPPAAAAPGGAPDGDPGYVPSSGVRTTILPGAPPGTGTAAPGTPAAGINSLPFGQRQFFAAQLAAAQGSADATSKVMSDINAAVTNWAQRPQKEIIPQAEARTLFGTAFDPTAIYARNRTDGTIEVTQQGQHPVNIADTPEAKAQAVALAIAQKRLETMQGQSDNATKIRNQLDVLAALNPKIGGADVLAAQYKPLISVMQSLGVGTPEERAQWSAQQAFTAAATQAAFQLRETGTGRLSNQELDAFRQVLPNIGQDQPTRALIIGMLGTMANRQLQETAYANNYFMQHHTLAGVDDAMDKDLGPVVRHAPGYGASAQDNAAFKQGLRPGQMYYKPNGALAMVPLAGG
jgi:soluble lytic murein transglycosylase-like protein